MFSSKVFCESPPRVTFKNPPGIPPANHSENYPEVPTFSTPGVTYRNLSENMSKNAPKVSSGSFAVVPHGNFPKVSCRNHEGFHLKNNQILWFSFNFLLFVILTNNAISSH